MSLIFIAVAINIGLNGLKRSQKSKYYYLVKLKAAHRASGGSAGARTIAGIVTTKGVLLSRYKAINIMKNLGLVVRLRSIVIKKQKMNI